MLVLRVFSNTPTVYHLPSISKVGNLWPCQTHEVIWSGPSKASTDVTRNLINHPVRSKISLYSVSHNNSIHFVNGTAHDDTHLILVVCWVFAFFIVVTQGL